MRLYERWCDASRERDKRKRYRTYVEKDGGRDQIRDDLAETIRAHKDGPDDQWLYLPALKRAR